MILVIFRLLSLIPTALKLRSDLALENLALRQQLAVLKRHAVRSKKSAVPQPTAKADICHAYPGRIAKKMDCTEDEFEWDRIIAPVGSP